MPLLRIEQLSKDFGNGPVLKGLSFDVEEGEFLTLLGPSGCGKTTTLRIIAGLETPTSGRVYLNGEDITSLPPEKRPVNTVFQSYALFPHMNVFQNIAYGLKIRGVAKSEQTRRVKEMLSLVQLSGFEERKPSQLSGGQRQRVAIARALVLNPKILLLDEPLGALDLKLRREMQQELKTIQRKLGTTFIYITHDQEEALNMSTRIAIMRDGQFEQIDTPEMIYEHPKTLFCCRFLGENNLLRGTVREKDGKRFLSACGALLLYQDAPEYAPAAGEEAVLSLQPHRLHYGEDFSRAFLTGELVYREYSAGMLHARIRLEDGTLLNAVSEESEGGTPLPVGSRVGVSWNPAFAPIVPWEAES